MKHTLAVALSFLFCLPIDAARISAPEFPDGPPDSLLQFKQRKQFSADNTLDDSDSVIPNIVGGEVVRPPFKYKFIGAIQKGDFQFCAGTFFGENLFVTAARIITL
jgi:hypothetical protein